MRCQCCNDNLSDYESTLKSHVTGEYFDTCLACLSESGIFSSAYGQDEHEREEDEI